MSNQLKPFQEKAFTLMRSVEYWFRQHYNLAPTDDRFLSATREQILVEYWASILRKRYEKMREDKVENPTLDDLLLEDKVEAAFKKEAEDSPVLEERVIDFRG